MQAAILAKLAPVFGAAGAEDYFRLGLCDTVHDFWKERKTAGSGASNEEGEEDELVDTSKLETVHATVDSIFSTTTGRARVDTTATIIKDITNQYATSLTNNFEWSVVRYFESKYPHIGTKKSTMTFDEILAIPNVPDQYANFKAVADLLGDSLELTGTNRGLKAYSPSERNRIANFMMVYMDSTTNPGVQQKAFTFDANARKIDLLFQDIEQIRNYVFPQTIADSAVTTLTPLRGRCVLHPPATPEVISNILTLNDTTIEFVNEPGFTRQNPYGFKLRVTKAGRRFDLPFSPTQKQGPTVNYLVGLMTRTAGSPPTSVLNLAGLAPIQTPSLLLDLKRMGDHEQVREAYNHPECYLATVDILCSLFARFLKKPCIFHTANTFRLYRFSSVPLDPDQTILKQHIFLAQDLLGKFTAVVDYNNKKLGRVVTDIDRAIAEFTVGQTAKVKSERTILDDVSAFFPGGVLKSTTEEEDGNLALTFATKLLQIRMLDLKRRATAVKRQLDAYIATLGLAAFQDSYTLLQEVSGLQGLGGEWSVENGILRRGDDDITSKLNTIKESVRVFGEIQQLEFPFNKDGIPIGVFTPLFEPVAQKRPGVPQRRVLKKAVKNIPFRFAGAAYTEIYQAIHALLIKRKGFGGARRPPADKVILADIGRYFTNRDAEKEAYFDEGLKTIVESLTDIPNARTPEQMVTVDIPNMLARVYAYGIPMEGGTHDDIEGDIEEEEPLVQTGGADVLQYYDLDTLFSEICSMAAIAIDSTLSQTPLSPGNVWNLSTIVCTDALKQAYQDIRSHWESGLSEIQLTAEDEYGEEFEDSLSEAYINSLFDDDSFISGGANGDDDPIARLRQRRKNLQSREGRPTVRDRLAAAQEAKREAKQKKSLEKRRKAATAAMEAAMELVDEPESDETRRNRVAIEFLGELLLTMGGVCHELVVLFTLAMFDDVRVAKLSVSGRVTPKARYYIYDNLWASLDGTTRTELGQYYNSEADWDRVWNHLQAVLIALRNKINPGAARAGRRTYRRKQRKDKRRATYRKRK